MILYEAATNPLEPTRIDRLPLRDLPHAAMVGATTWSFPGARPGARSGHRGRAQRALPELPYRKTWIRSDQMLRNWKPLR